MKKLVVAFLVLVSITSCHDDVLEFSCNPDVNEFVKSNILILSCLTLDEFLTMSLSKQRAAFRSYSPEKRLELWTEKLEKVLSIGSWTEQEVTHIETLINQLSVESFTKYEEENPLRIENEVFFIKWQDYALNVLNWEKGRLAFVISSLFLSETDYKYSLLQEIDNSYLIDDYHVYDCACNIGTDFCGSTTCQDTGCNSTSSGCGWLWMEDCNGECI